MRDEVDAAYEAFAAPRCEDCGILLARHGDDCGIETTDPRYEPAPLAWVDGLGCTHPLDEPWPPTDEGGGSE